MELALPSIEAADQLEWLNKPFPKEAQELIQRGLLKKVFHAIKNRETRSRAEALDHLL
jgi:hypothetical protein